MERKGEKAGHNYSVEGTQMHNGDGELACKTSITLVHVNVLIY